MSRWNFLANPALVTALILSATLLNQGCSSNRSDSVILPGQITPAPPPPPFLTGSMGLLLTNADFSARAMLHAGAASNRVETAVGELLARDGSLLFAPAFSEPGEKPLRQAGVSFIWNTREATGYILSEGLQAYAQIRATVQFTRISAEAASGANERIDGHECTHSKVTMRFSDGTEELFDVWSAADLKNLPLRIVRSGNRPLSLSLSRVRLEEAPADMFRPPTEFTRYQSPESLMTELSIRQHNLRRK